MTKKPLNILFVISMLEGMSGPVRSLYLLALSFSKMGHHVYVAYYLGNTDDAAQIFVKENIKIIDLRAKHLENTLFHRFRLMICLNKFVRKNKIDVVHAHSWDADWYAYLSTFFNKVKFITTIHSVSYVVWAKQHLNHYRKFIIPKAAHIICVCNYLKEEFVHLISESNKKISTIYNTPSDEFFANLNIEKRRKIRQQFNISDKDILLGTIGNASWVKGMNCFLEALTKLTIDNFKVLMVGRGYDKSEEELKSFINQNGLKEKIIFAGFQKDIPAILDALDIFIHPSVEEADPWVVSEAMAKGKAIVATRIGGIPEKISDASIGLLVPSQDPEALAKAIDHYCLNPDQIDKMGNAAKLHIQNQFPFTKMINQHEELYFSK